MDQLWMVHTVNPHPLPVSFGWNCHEWPWSSKRYLTNHSDKSISKASAIPRKEASHYSIQYIVSMQIYKGSKCDKYKRKKRRKKVIFCCGTTIPCPSHLQLAGQLLCSAFKYWLKKTNELCIMYNNNRHHVAIFLKRKWCYPFTFSS